MTSTNHILVGYVDLHCSALAPTLVCPNLYWLWSMSKEARSFSAAFLLSTNLSSGIAWGFRMR